MEGTTLRLEELPADVLNRILDFILPTPCSLDIHHQGFRDCYSFCCNHSRLYSLLRSRMRTVSVDFLASLSDKACRAFGRLIGPSVDSLTLYGFRGSMEHINSMLESFFEGLEQKQNHLTKLCIRPTHARILSSTLARFGSLPEFSLHSLTISGGTDTILSIPLPACSLQNLRYLCLSCATFSCFDVLFNLISVPGKGLSHLKLMSIFFEYESNEKRTLNDVELLQIGEVCPNITHIHLDHLINCTSSGLHDFFASLTNLSALVCSDPFIWTPDDAAKIFSSCTRLEHLSLISSVGHENLKRALGPVNNVLKTLEIAAGHRLVPCHRVFGSWTHDLQFTRLRRLSIRFLGVGPDFASFLGKIGYRLELLYVYCRERNDGSKNYFDFNSLWRAISKCEMLQTLRLVVRIMHFPKEYSDDNDLLDDMFRRIGMTLENFELNCFAYSHLPLSRRLPWAEGLLSSMSLSIAKHCQNMRVFNFFAPSMMYHLHRPQDRQKCARLGIRVPNMLQHHGGSQLLPKSPYSF